MDSSAFDSLTPGEAAVVRLLLQARDQKTVARELGISPETVKTHLRNAREKTGASTSFALARSFAHWEASHPFRVIPSNVVDPLEPLRSSPAPTRRPADVGTERIDEMAFRETMVEFDYELRSSKAERGDDGRTEVLPAYRLLLAGALALMLIVIILLAFPLSESFQRFADVLDQPTH